MTISRHLTGPDLSDAIRAKAAGGKVAKVLTPVLYPEDEG